MISKLKIKYMHLKLKWERSLIKQNMELKREIRALNKKLDESNLMNHKLIDEITLKNIKIRELDLGVRYDK